MRSIHIVMVLALGAPYVAGCEGPMLIDRADAGSTATADAGPLDAGGDAGTDAGVPIEPMGGSECDQQDDCAACFECAQDPAQRCVGAALQCEQQPECLALAGCIGGCGDDAECVQACAAAHPSGTTLLLSVYRCLYCDACPGDCRADHATWCEAAPF